nr:MAG TPA: hypothetical protein [Caudoviricetes sp.]
MPIRSYRLDYHACAYTASVYDIKGFRAYRRHT